MWKTVLLLLSSLVAKSAFAQTSKIRAEEALRKNLLQNYDKNARPSPKTMISLSSITILNFEMHEADHSVDLHSWMSLTWEDPRMKWKAEENMDISHIGIDSDTLWKPDLSVYNAASGDKTVLKSQLPMLVYATGTVLHVPVYNMHFSCIMDLTYWPHDTHNCSLKIGSWIHSGNLMDLELKDFEIKFEIPSSEVVNGQNLSRTEWNISKINAVREVKYYACCEEPYIDILITLLIKRNAPAFAWTVKVPAACLSILTIVIFLMPPNAGEKLVFGGLLLLLDLLFIDCTSSTISHAPSHTPLIVQLVCQQVIIVMVSVIISAIVVRMSRDPHSTGLPAILKGPITALSYILCLSNYATLGSGDYGALARNAKADEVELGEECNGDLRKKERSAGNEWLVLAAVVDRLAFLLYLAVCIISLIRFSSVL